MKRILLNLILFSFAVLCIPLTAFINPVQTVDSSETGNGNLSQGSNTGQTDNFKLLRINTGEILELSAADYIKGVVAAEIPMDYEVEAIKAQAVAAHTYALRMRDIQKSGESSDLKGADFSDDPAHYQAYVNRAEFNKMYGDRADELWKKCSDAVDSVLGKIMLYKDQPIAAAFHSTSSGKTESAEVVWGNAFAYLVPVDSKADENAPSYRSEKQITCAEVEQALKKAYSDFTPGKDKAALFQIKKRSDSGTITELQAGNITLSGIQLRAMLSLSSANFEVTYRTDSDNYIFTTKGLGHGVGMSQYGANEMASSGKTYDEILKHYYTGVEISDL